MRITRSRTAIAGLLVTLLASNAWWANQSIDRSVSLSYLEASYATESELLKQMAAVLNVIVSPDATRDNVVRAAQLGASTNAPFEKEGYVWVGQLGLRFDAHAKLQKAVLGPQEDGQ